MLYKLINQTDASIVTTDSCTIRRWQEATFRKASLLKSWLAQQIKQRGVLPLVLWVSAGKSVWSFQASPKRNYHRVTKLGVSEIIPRILQTEILLSGGALIPWLLKWSELSGYRVLKSEGKSKQSVFHAVPCDWV